MPAVDADLRTLLASAEVHEDIITYLGNKKCVNVALFANWFDEPAEVATLVQATTQKDETVEVAKLKLCWRKASAATEHAVKRSAEGLPEEGLDDPLPVPMQKDIVSAWQKYYHWSRLDPRKVCMDGQFGRFRREFLNCQPSMFAVSRVRSLAQSQKSPVAKKQKLSEHVRLEYVHEDGQDESEMSDVIQWMKAHAILCDTWAVVGTFDVMYPADATEPMKYAEWEATSAYHFEFEHKYVNLRAKYTDGSLFAYISTVEEIFRAKAVELARSADKMPWGKALTSCLKEEAEAWNFHKDMLVERVVRNGPRSALRHSAPSGNRGGGFASRVGKKFQTVLKDSGVYQARLEQVRLVCILSSWRPS